MKQQQVIEKVLSKMLRLSPDELADKVLKDWAEGNSIGLALGSLAVSKAVTPAEYRTAERMYFDCQSQQKMT